MEIIDKQDYVLNFIEIRDGLDQKEIHKALVYKHGITEDELQFILSKLVKEGYLINEGSTFIMSEKGLNFFEKSSFRKEHTIERRKEKLRLARNIAFMIIALMILGISCQMIYHSHQAANHHQEVNQSISHR